MYLLILVMALDYSEELVGAEGGFLVLQDSSPRSGQGFGPIDISTLWISLTLSVLLVLTQCPRWLPHHRGQALDASHAAFPGRKAGGEAHSA